MFTEFRHQISEMTLIPSSGGVFEVTLDGRKIFSKKELGRHAEEGELVKLLRQETGD